VTQNFADIVSLRNFRFIVVLITLQHHKGYSLGFK